MKLLQKSFLSRRRYDRIALALAAFAMPLRIGIGPIILFIYSCIGIYLAADRRRIHRLYAPWFFALITAYMLWSLGLMAFRGELVADNRQIGYVLLLWLFSFAGFGMVLVRNPLRSFVLGARLGILGCAITTIVIDFYIGGRIGVGGNAAVFGFAVGIAAISASIHLKESPAYLPNGIYYLLVGGGIVFATQTRAIMVTLPLFILVEIVIAVRRLESRKLRSGVSIGLLALFAAMISVGPVPAIVSQRFAGMVHYYQTGDSSQWQDKVSADTRQEMWSGASKVIIDNIITGVGPTQKMPAVRAQLSENATLLDGYLHVHNAILDELLTNGAIGLALLLAAFVSGISFIWKHNCDSSIRRALIYYSITIAGYGMLHNPLLHEMTIAAMMFFFATLYAVTRRQIAQLAGSNVLQIDAQSQPAPTREVIVSI